MRSEERQGADGRRQEADGRRQEADGRSRSRVELLNLGGSGTGSNFPT